jgi:hypothetical protein
VVVRSGWDLLGCRYKDGCGCLLPDIEFKAGYTTGFGAGMAGVGPGCWRVARRSDRLDVAASAVRGRGGIAECLDVCGRVKVAEVRNSSVSGARGGVDSGLERYAEKVGDLEADGTLDDGRVRWGGRRGVVGLDCACPCRGVLSRGLRAA